MGQSGIYKIISRKTGKIYIGESHNLSKRISRHKTDLRYHTHNNKYLQRHAIKYGINDLIFEIQEILPPIHNHLIRREIYWINFFSSNNYKKGFNLNKGGLGGYSTCLKHKDFILVKLKEGKEYRFENIEKFEEFTGLVRHKIREVLLKERKTSMGWTTPENYERVIQKIQKKLIPKKFSPPPLQSKQFKIRNLQTGEIFEGKNILKFSREKGLCYCSLLRVIKGERKRHKIWLHVD